MQNQFKFNSIIFGIFFIISTIINNNPQAQFLHRQQQRGSFSSAKNQNFGQQIGIGNQVGINSALSNSKTVTQGNGSGRNVAKSNSLTQGGNIGNLGISSTVTGTKSRTNGHLSGGSIGHDLNIGGVDLGSSISPDNLKSIGLHRNSKGGAEIGLGLLKLDLSKGTNPIASGQTSSNAGATGDIAKARANANAKKTNFGLIDLTSTNSNSKSFGASRNGQTSANAGGNVNSGGTTNARPQPGGLLQTFFGRRKRDLAYQHKRNYISIMEKQKILPCSQPKNCTSKQSEGRTFGLVFDALQGLFGPANPVIVPPPVPIPHHPVIHHQPIHPPHIKPCCYSCHRPTYSNCHYYPTPPRIIGGGGYGTGGNLYSTPGLLYGGLYNGGLNLGGFYGGGSYGNGIYGNGIYGGGSFQATGGNPLVQDQLATSTANGNRNGQSSGTVLDIGPISYSSSTSNIGTTLLQMLFG